MASKVGRPSKYKKEYCEELIEHMSSGLSYETFSAVINVDRSTIYEWETKHKEFSDAKRNAFEKNQLFWERVGIEGMFMGGKDNPFNSTVWIFNMKNRFNWRDKSEVKNENNGSVNIIIDKDDESL